MTLRGNQMIPNAHFHKKWQRRVRVKFDEPARKLRKRIKRVKRARRLAPRPTELLRPAVRCPTVRYHTKLRFGRGFTLKEIRRARLNPSEARSIGIAVDRRRRNSSVEGLLMNVQRLKEYKSRLILFPKNEKAPIVALASSPLLPIKQIHPSTKARVITEAEKKFCASLATRKIRRYVRRKQAAKQAAKAAEI